MKKLLLFIIVYASIINATELEKKDIIVSPLNSEIEDSQLEGYTVNKEKDYKYKSNIETASQIDSFFKEKGMSEVVKDLDLLDRTRLQYFIKTKKIDRIKANFKSIASQVIERIDHE